MTGLMRYGFGKFVEFEVDVEWEGGLLIRKLSLRGELQIT